MSGTFNPLLARKTGLRRFASAAFSDLSPRRSLRSREMAGLDPNVAAVRAAPCCEHRAGGQPQPRLRLESLVAVAKTTFENEDFDPASRGLEDLRVRAPTFQAHVLVRVLI